MEAHVHGCFRRRGAASGLGGYPGEIIQLSVPNPSAVLVDPPMSSCRGDLLFGFIPQEIPPLYFLWYVISGSLHGFITLEKGALRLFERFGVPLLSRFYGISFA